MRIIGFIGLGTMGSPMALNLLNKGYEVVLYNRTRGVAESLAAGRPSASVAASPKEVAREADIVVTMLGDDASVESIYYGANGLFGGLRAGMTVVDCSTVSPELSRRLAADMEEHLADFLDAPVTGSKPAAESGTLLFMVGGREEALDGVRDVLSAMGRAVVHMGPSGAGSQTKLAHNAIAGIIGAAVAEGLAMAVKAGVDPAKFLDVVGSGGAASRFLELKKDKLLAGDFSNQFSLKLMFKDLKLASAFAGELQVPTPVLSATKELFAIGESRGLGELDFSSIARVYEDWIRVSVRGASAPADAASEASAAPTAEAASAAANGKSDDRRRAPRVALNIPLHISVYQWEQEGSFSGQQIEATLYDLSESGLQVRSSFPLAVDMFVVIHFPQEADLPPITGKIIRVVPDRGAFRYGCMLSGLPPFVRLQLEEYLQRKATS
ncbi:NAD(P)-binding domain-containing protein [Paenibacillus sp.]|uniref:NAD(P)-binding domain-containing protein n=1 Tax=Paenibacillus sp. TaxID=58172 RepID=UPI0028122452|nr:NAD(P)-binding domain-containing protein [Paenibacillus sp.]